MAEKLANPSDQPSTSQQPNPPTAEVPSKLLTSAANWLKKKTTKNLASLESQSNQLIAPDGTQINIDSLPDTVSVLIAESASGHTSFDQTVGTQTTAKDHHFIAFTNLEELETSGRWILGRILAPSTSRKRAATSKYSENWHNFTLLKLLSGPNDWQSLTGSSRCINLKLGANWCIIWLNVPAKS